ncbi:MAG: hypothetical protein JJE04_26145 [Acidobacteriia bacterium]|nr:hypothetical protein [Terriglobia bacterium]
MRVARLILLMLAACGWVMAVDWSLFRSGPVEVLSSANDKESRQVLATFDQLRYITAKLMGRQELTPLWPVRLVVVNKRPGQDGPSAHLELRRDAYSARLMAGAPVPVEMLREFLQILIRDDTVALPVEVEQGFIEALSHAAVDATRITFEAPPDKTRRTKEWARMYLFALHPDYSGRIRVFFSNLGQGAGLDTGFRNSIGMSAADVDAEVARRLEAGQFEPLTQIGRALNPDRDYRPRPVDALRALVFLADLQDPAAARKSYQTVLNRGAQDPDAYDGAGLYAEAVAKGSENARAWVRHGQSLKDPVAARAAYQKAAQLNPRWSEPHIRSGELEATPGKQYPYFKKAADLEPRNTALWEKLAETQLAAKDFSGAGQSWRMAARTAPTEKERQRLEQRREAFEQRRIDLQVAEQKRIEEEKRKELAALKEQALANIRAAELRANAAAGAADPNRKVVDWWDGPRNTASFTGQLERVDCLKGQLRLVLRGANKKLVQLLIADPGKIVLSGGGEHTLGCGVQKPPRRMKVDYSPKKDPKLATEGEVGFIEFQ